MGSSGSSTTKLQRAATRNTGSVITSSDKVLLELKLQRDRLLAAIKKYEQTSQLEYAKAVELFKNGKRKEALHYLKRRKAQTSQITLVTNMLDNVERLLDTVEFSLIQREVVDALKSGKNELSKLNAILKVDSISLLMDETADLVEETKQVNEILMRNMIDYDENTLLNELDFDGKIAGPSSVVADNVVIPRHELPSTTEQFETMAGEREQSSQLA